MQNLCIAHIIEAWSNTDTTIYPTSDVRCLYFRSFVINSYSTTLLHVFTQLDIIYSTYIV